jgi:hypothetical protein
VKPADGTHDLHAPAPWPQVRAAIQRFLQGIQQATLIKGRLGIRSGQQLVQVA